MTIHEVAAVSVDTSVWAPLYVGFTFKIPFDKGPVISYNDFVTMDSLLTDSEDVFVKAVENLKAVCMKLYLWVQHCVLSIYTQ